MPRASLRARRHVRMMGGGVGTGCVAVRMMSPATVYSQILFRNSAGRRRSREVAWCTSAVYRITHLVLDGHFRTFCSASVRLDAMLNLRSAHREQVT